MRALVRDQAHDPPVAVQEVEAPEPGAGEALVEVHASSLNRGELSLLANRPDGWRPGQDLAGVIARSAADGVGPREGERVVGLVEGGAWAELVAVSVERLAILPTGVPFEHAATLPIAGLTALRTLRHGASLLGRRVLITGASGGVGQFAVQLARAAGGRVSALVSDASAHPDLLGLGAERVIDRHDDTDEPFEFILEGLGGPSLSASVGVVAPGGTIVLYGAVSPEPASLGLLDFFGHEGATIHAFFSYAAARQQDTGLDLSVLADLVDRGELRPAIATTADFDHAADAITALSNRRLHGKVVFTPTAE